jgi:DNA-binding NarL/FixJ family response regulator
MGTMNRNELALETMVRPRELETDEILDFEMSKSNFRYTDEGTPFSRKKYTARNVPKNTDWVKYVEPANRVDKFRILIAGDEKSARSIRISMSLHLNFPVDYVEASNGKLSFQLIDREELDLIIFGEGVADMNGLEFLEGLNRKFWKQKIPVIEIFDSNDISVGVQAMKMGAHDYLLTDSEGHHFELLPILVSRIHAEKQTMNVLRQTAGIHQTLSDSIPSVIYQLSLQGGRHCLSISPKILQLGFSSDKWGSDVELHHQMCHEDDRPAVKKALEYSYATGTNFQCEYRINTFGKTLHWFNDKAKIVMDKSGRPLFMQGVMTDITSVKVLEDELLLYRGVLDKLVQQRTERLNRRVSILESCNAHLGESNYKLRQRYIDLQRKCKK